VNFKLLKISLSYLAFELKSAFENLEHFIKIFESLELQTLRFIVAFKLSNQLMALNTFHFF